MTDLTERRKYRVLMIAACPFPANYGTSGCIKEMCEVMGDRGHEIHVLTYPYGDGSPVRSVTLHRVPHLGWSREIAVGPTLQRPLFDLLMVFKAIHLAWKYKCEIIHTHNYEGQLIGICAKVLTWRPLLYNAINTMADELLSYNAIKPVFIAKGLARFLDWFAPRISDHILTLTSDLKDILVSWGLPKDHITVVPAGVQLEMFSNADPLRFRKIWNLGSSRTVLYAGTIDQFQRVDILIDAFSRLGPECADVLLLIVFPFARRERKEELAAQAQKLGIADRVRFVDEHPLEDLPDCLALADVAVVPRPQCPGHPIKLLNYMAAGRPIVVSAGGAKGIRHLENGFIFPDHDAAGLAQGITTLLHDRELSARLGTAARQTILEEYDWRILAQKIEGIYAGMLAKKTPWYARGYKRQTAV